VLTLFISLWFEEIIAQIARADRLQVLILILIRSVRKFSQIVVCSFLSSNNFMLLCQVVLSISCIIWYRPGGGDALRLGR